MVESLTEIKKRKMLMKSLSLEVEQWEIISMGLILI